MASCRAELGPPNISISDSGCLDAGCWKDWGGLEEVTEVTEGIGMGGGDWKDVPHARAEELGGFAHPSEGPVCP